MSIPHPTVTTGLFLLLLQEDGRPEALGQYTGYGLAGAMLADLAAAGRVDVADEGHLIRVRDVTPTGDRLLDEGLARFLGHDGKRVSIALAAIGRRLEHTVGEYLAERGVVQVQEGGWLGLKPRRYPEEDGSMEAELREGLVEVLRGAEPTLQQHAMLGLVSALEIPTAVFDRKDTGLSNRELKDRTAELRETAGPEVDGVARAVRSMHAAVLTGALSANRGD
ncbi:GOLPH3/VPS74 family protein [Micrococcus luteus]